MSCLMNCCPNTVVILTCSSRCIGIKKDAGQASMTDRDNFKRGFTAWLFFRTLSLCCYTILEELKTKIRQAQYKAVISANKIIFLYWDIGKTILIQQEKQGWGAKVIDRLSQDLCKTFPDMKGLSSRNLKYMRQFASLYPDPVIVQEVLAQLQGIMSLL